MIELRMEHADLDALIDRAGIDAPVDELMIRRLKKRRLALRDEIARLERLPVRPWSRPDLRDHWVRIMVEELTGRRIGPSA